MTDLDRVMELLAAFPACELGAGDEYGDNGERMTVVCGNDYNDVICALPGLENPIAHAIAGIVNYLRSPEFAAMREDADRWLAVNAMACSDEGPSDALLLAWMTCDKAAATAAIDEARRAKGE